MKNRLYTILISISLTSVFSIIFISESFCQWEYARLDVGRFTANHRSYKFFTTGSGTGSGPWFVWPNGTYRRGLIQAHLPGLVADKIVYGVVDGVDRGTEENEAVQIELGGAGSWSPTHYMEHRRWKPPDITVDGILLTPPYDKVVDNYLDCDVMIVNHNQTLGRIGVAHNLTLRTWANQYHQDYIMHDNEIILNLEIDDIEGQDIPDQTPQIFFYNNFTFVTSYWGQSRTYSSWMPNTNWHAFKLFPSKLMQEGKIPPRPRDELGINYAYDADMKRVTKPRYITGSYPIFDDTGDPDPYTGEILSPQYIGFATFHADKSVNDPTDDPNQPSHAGYHFLTQHIWSGNWEIDKFDYFMQKTFKLENFNYGYEEPRQKNWCMQHSGHGPYLMSKDNKFEVVFALGVGGIDKSLCVSKGAEWYSHYIANDPNIAQYDQEKNELIATGMDSLIQCMDRAYWNYAVRNYDIPDPPPTPDITVTSGPLRIDVKWGYPNANMFKDPDHGTDDLKEWVLYRKIGDYYESSPQDAYEWIPYEEIGRFPKGVTSYLDTDVIRGRSYHYCVRAFDDGTLNDGLFPGTPLGSSYYQNRTTEEVLPFKTGLETSDEVVIVPNPYSLSTGVKNVMNFDNTNEIQFMGLPPFCTLKIYTATGDLIHTIEHKSGSGDERWEELRTDSNQRPMSGVYILVVDNARDLNNFQLPKRFYKFVIVR